MAPSLKDCKVAPSLEGCKVALGYQTCNDCRYHLVVDPTTAPMELVLSSHFVLWRYHSMSLSGQCY